MISALVLAAGEGRRLGIPKALAMLGEQSLLERVLRILALTTVDEIVIACGARGHEVAALAESVAANIPAMAGMPLRIVQHEGWAAGRTSSIQAAWHSCPAGAHALIFPVDHPLVRITTLDTMLGVHGYASADIEIIVPVVEVQSQRRRGHPVLFSASRREEVLGLGPDEPLRDVVARHAVLEVPVDDEGILVNIDTPEDLARAAAGLG